MIRTNVTVTEEAYAILKAEAKRLGSSMGTVVTIMCLERMKQEDAPTLVKIIEEERSKQGGS